MVCIYEAVTFKHLHLFLLAGSNDPNQAQTGFRELARLAVP